MAIPISAVIMTRDEAENLPACLESVAWADDVLVVDSYSTDNTVELARQAGARIVEHAFANYAAQRNFAQSQAQYDWILFVDADERITPVLRDEIRALAASGELDRCLAYHIQRVHLISGRWFTTPPDRMATPALRRAIRNLEVPRLFDRRQAVWERALHEVVKVPQPHGVLDGVICHYASTNLSLGMAAFNDYTDVEAAYLHGRGRRASVLSALGRGFRTFAYHYFLQAWFRYGENGLLMAALAGMNKFMHYAKLWERRRIEAGQGVWTERDRQMLAKHTARAREQ